VSDGTILIVGGGLLQVAAVAITDRDSGAVCVALADEAYTLDTKDVAGHVALAERLKARGDLVAVFTEGADVEVTVAEAAAAAGLPGVDPAAARTVNDKMAFRRRCAEAGLPGPRFGEARTAAEARAVAAEIGLPLIVKPRDSSGSRGTVKVESVDLLDAAVADAARFSSDGVALLEQLLTGPEQSVDTLVGADGTHWRCNIVDRPFVGGRYAIEIGHDNPTTLDAARQDELYALVERTARAVGIDVGAAKADTMWTADGPVVLEMTARLSGGFHCQYTSPLAYGTNDVKAAMDLALGRPLDPADVTPRWHRHALCRSLFPAPGRIVSVAGVERALAIDGVAHVLSRMGPGDVIEPYRTCVDRPCFVIAVGDTRDDALAAMAAAERTIVIETEAVPA
jgi:biotin carboxylase